MEMARIRSVLTEEQKADIVAKRRAAAAAALSSTSGATAAEVAAEATSPPPEHKLSETAKSDSGSYDAPLKANEEPKDGGGDTR